MEDLLGFLQDLSDFNKDVCKFSKDNPYYEEQIHNALKDLKLNLGLCPECKEMMPLNTQHYYENHSELDEFGYHFKESMEYSECPNCGWNNKNI